MQVGCILCVSVLQQLLLFDVKNDSPIFDVSHEPVAVRIQAADENLLQDVNIHWGIHDT